MSKHRFQDLSLFPDCIALLLNGRCTRLNVSNCQGKACPFKRTREEDNNSIQYSCQRLSNPATYIGVFDMIRDLFAFTPEAKV